jgi:hypothetical protein
MKYATIVTIALFASSVVCSAALSADNHATVSGSATAERNPDGSITTRQATTAEINSLEYLRYSLSQINSKYPGPQLPTNAKKIKVSSVDSSGNLLLENGLQLTLEGVKCTPQGITYLQKSLEGNTDRIIYTPSSANNQNPIRAYIWHFFGVGYHQLNEGALTSGWCVQDKSVKHTYQDRYEALSKIARTSK